MACQAFGISNLMVILLGAVVSLVPVDQGEEPPVVPQVQIEKRKAIMTMVYNRIAAAEQEGITYKNLNEWLFQFNNYKYTDAHADVANRTVLCDLCIDYDEGEL